jgi:hypothetical protein
MGLGINLAINLYSPRWIFRNLEMHPKCKIIPLSYYADGKNTYSYMLLWVKHLARRPSSLSYCFMWLNLPPAISFSNNIDKHACSAPIKFDPGITHLLVKKI